MRAKTGDGKAAGATAAKRKRARRWRREFPNVLPEDSIFRTTVEIVNRILDPEDRWEAAGSFNEFLSLLDKAESRKQAFNVKFSAAVMTLFHACETLEEIDEAIDGVREVVNLQREKAARRKEGAKE